jgi:3-methyladenine DNA glycosylase AlkD
MVSAEAGGPLNFRSMSAVPDQSPLGSGIPVETTMTAKPKKLGTTAASIKRKPANRSSDDEVQAVLAWLKQNGTKAARDGMARFAIPSDRAFGISVGALRQQAKRLGPNHALAAALWKTGWYEARMLATFIAEPGRVTPAQMDRWVQDFDNWAICDTACFHLFDRTADPWRKVKQWSGRREEFVRRAGFALMWSLSVHDKQAGDEPFVAGLALIEGASTDERNFVKKAVNMALRAIGKRNRSLNAAAVTVARRLAASPHPTARWVGKDALRELTSPAVTQRLARRPAGRRSK